MVTTRTTTSNRSGSESTTMKTRRCRCRRSCSTRHATTVLCYLATTASAVNVEQYDWTCEDCRNKFPAGTVRQHCRAHCVDVCEPCCAVRIAAQQYEVEPMPSESDDEEPDNSEEAEDPEDEEHNKNEGEEELEEEYEEEQEDGASNTMMFLEQEAEEASEADSEEASDEDEQDGTDDSASESSEASEDDRTDVSEAESDAPPTEETETTVTTKEMPAATEVEQLLRGALDKDEEMAPTAAVAADTLARLDHLWREHPSSLCATIDLCTVELHANGYGRVRIEADGALLRLFVSHLTGAHVPVLLRALKRLRAQTDEQIDHQQLFDVLLARACLLSPESREALQEHSHWHAASSRHRTKVADELITALGDASVSVEAFCAGPLKQYRQTFPALHFSPALLRDGLLHRVADVGGDVTEAAASLAKLGHVWTAYPLTGVTSMLRAIARWSALVHANEWRKYGPAIRHLIAKHVSAHHLDALVEASRAALRTPIVYPLLAPLYARLTELAPSGVVATFADMHALSQEDAEALDHEAEERDAREMAAETDEELPQEDLDFVDRDDGRHELPEVVQRFALARILEMDDDPRIRLRAGDAYSAFVTWFQAEYPGVVETDGMPSQKAFGNEFQRLYPNKVRTRVVSYIGITLLH